MNIGWDFSEGCVKKADCWEVALRTSCYLKCKLDSEYPAAILTFKDGNHILGCWSRKKELWFPEDTVDFHTSSGLPNFRLL